MAQSRKKAAELLHSSYYIY